MKLYMLWDMEGVSGLFTREHVWHWEEGVRPQIAEEGRQLLINDINSASQAALEAGADELIVSDTHSGGNNIRLESMLDDPRITHHASNFIKQSDIRRWMPDMDETIDGLLLLGHHAKAGTLNAFLPHTWSGNWQDVQINGQSVGEVGLEACFAAHWNIPLILVQGDDATQNEIKNQYPWVVTACVKQAQNNDLCTGPTAKTGRQITATKIREAITKLRDGLTQPYKPKLPLTITITMTTPEAVEKASANPNVNRIDDITIKSRADRHGDVLKWILGLGE
ncbi:MAG: M55 family metallopeptidase [Candidatus Latescibacteria bacterium]|nr:M55 family metallopeptidase [Candidatus Latescibacterota bacterium]